MLGAPDHNHGAFAGGVPGQVGLDPHPDDFPRVGLSVHVWCVVDGARVVFGGADGGDGGAFFGVVDTRVVEAEKFGEFV